MGKRNFEAERLCLKAKWEALLRVSLHVIPEQNVFILIYDMRKRRYKFHT